MMTWRLMVLLPLTITCYSVSFTHAKAEQPNIILIVADDLGYNDVGYHNSEINTPNIDEFSLHGVRLENYYVQPTCSPSRAELLTGRHGINTGFYGGDSVTRSGVPLQETLLPERLRELGYINHHVGKWHLGYHSPEFLPTNRGYHSFFGFHTGQMDYYSKIKCERIVGHKYSQRVCGYDLWQDTHVYRGNESLMYSTHLFTDRAVNIIKHHSQTNDSFFMTLAYQGVHSPAQAPEECIALNPHIENRKRMVYAGMVSCLDQGIGNITQALRDTGLWNNTVLIFTTDNGGYPDIGGSNWPLRGEKNSIFEGGIRAVGFVASPLLQLQEGHVDNNLYHITDWYPTILQIASGESPDNLDGFNIWDSLKLGGNDIRSELLLHMNLRKKGLAGTEQATQYSAALREGEWKLIIGFPGEGSWKAPDGSEHQSTYVSTEYDKSIWLFNIKEDPTEKTDLVFTHPQIAKRLLKRLQSYYLKAKSSRRHKPSMISDPWRHGNVWGPWELRHPEVDYYQKIGGWQPTETEDKEVEDQLWNYLYKLWWN